MKYILPILFLTLFLPGIAKAEIKISEIAWMGTAESQFSEWIELYNASGESIDLAGWKIYEAGGGTLIFTLTKSIPSGGYLILERTTASAPDAVPGISDEVGSFGGAGLANTGEHLVLKDNSGSLVDELDFQAGWPAGDSTTKETMQLSGTDWITASATPKAPNGDGPSQETEISEEEEEEIDIIPKVSPNKPLVEFIVPPIVFPGVAYEFIAAPVLEYNYRIREGNFYWNMGDGTVYRQVELAPVTHTYQYAGEYTIYLSYTDPNNHNPPLKGSKKVKVVKPNFSIAIVSGRGLEIKNTSATEIDLSNWKVITQDRQIQIPEMTLIAPKATVVVPFSVLSIGYATDISIADPSGNILATTQKALIPKQIEKFATEEISIGKPFSEDEELVAFAGNIFDEADIEKKDDPKRNRTKTFIFGAVALFVIVLSILLERFMARQEYQ